MSTSGSDEHLLTPAEVASLFRVDPKTVTRWAKAGKLTSIRTLGGHRRYRADEVYALLEAQSPSRNPDARSPEIRTAEQLRAHEQRSAHPYQRPSL